MSNLGYIYVLANSAMPGLVKIGKTTRTPSERANELAGVTGLPTPFIVVYEQLFEDCSTAESFVHTLLSEKGYRISNNREFFNAPTNEVVRAIALAPGAVSEDVAPPTPSSVEHGADGATSIGDLDAGSHHPKNIFSNVIEEARRYYLGEGDYLQDYKKSLALFKKAAKLGSLYAYDMVGEMYSAGLGSLKNRDLALEYLGEGARRGNAMCYWTMAKIFLLAGECENADKCFSRFEERYLTDANSSDEEIIFLGTLYNDCFLFIRLKTNSNWNTTPKLDEIIASNKEDILDIAREIYAKNSKNEFYRVITYLQNV